MVARKARPKKRLSLSRGRPPTSNRTLSVSSKVTRTVIRTHHKLQKAHSQALALGKHEDAARIAAQIAANGGLQVYQEASKTGQSLQRGGDSSSVLVEWIKTTLKDSGAASHVLRVLEVGALSTKNAIAKLSNVEVTRIDLRSQEKGILQQDFMERPLPTVDEQRFHIISLSLVLNYVSDAVGRGSMLRRTTQFLCTALPQPLSNQLPCLFLVLPAACVLNSRYLTEETLEDMLGSLGYVVIAKKLSPKLIYYLLHLETTGARERPFKKEELRPGSHRNNFAITMC